MGLTWKERIELVKLLVIDVFMMLFFIAVTLPGVSLNQLIEDKVCRNSLNLSESLCLNLESLDDSHDKEKNEILSKAAAFKNYSTILQTLPGLFMSLFIGFWIDTYPKHLRYILASPALGAALANLITVYFCFHFETNYMYLLIADGIRGLSGGFAIIFTCSYTYITKKTPAKFRATRFAILEFFTFTATPISIFLGGYILTMDPWVHNQLRNYIGVIAVSGASAFTAFIWLLLFLQDPEPIKLPSQGSRNREEDQEKASLNSHENNSINSTEEEIATSDLIGEADQSDLLKSEPSVSTLKNIFNVEVVRTMMKTCTKKRENGLRMKLWHTMIMCSFVLLGYMGESAIGFQFAQKVYHWNAAKYSNVSSVMIFVSSLSTTLLLPTLSRGLKCLDTTIGIIGLVSLVISMIIRGSWLTQYGYYTAVIAGTFSGLTPISIRAFLSRMISFHEIGQIFSLLSCIESFAPVISSLFYSTVFQLTIGSYPGLIYQISAMLLFYPLMVIFWLDITRKDWYFSNQHESDVQNTTMDDNINDKEQATLASTIGSLNAECSETIEPTVDSTT